MRPPVCPVSSALWKNDRSDPDAVWHHRSDGSRDEAGNGVWGLHWKGYLGGANLGRAIVTNGGFTTYVCYSAATTRPSSQITLGRLVVCRSCFAAVVAVTSSAMETQTFFC